MLTITTSSIYIHARSYVTQRILYIVQDMVKATVELIDLLGIYCTVTRVVNKGEMKIMVTAIGMYIYTLIYYNTAVRGLTDIYARLPRARIYQSNPEQSCVITFMLHFA